MALLRPDKLFFTFTLFTGIFIAVSSSSWYMCWLGLELNLLSFVPLIFSEKNAYSSESALKYFFIQAMGSIMILVGATLLIMLKSFQVEKVIVCGLLFKMGAAPVHFWVPTVMQGLSWGNCILLMTVQKIAPMGMMVMSPDTLIMQDLLTGASILSGILGGVGGLNQVLLRKILAYSSISHMGWLLAVLCFDTVSWGFYLFLYSFTLVVLVFVLNSSQIFHSHQLTNFVCGSIPMVGVFLTLFSLGGLPPLLGFMAKVIVISLLASQSCLIWLFILTMSSLITLYFYTRLLISSLTLNMPKVGPTSNQINLGIGVFTVMTWVMVTIPFFFS